MERLKRTLPQNLPIDAGLINDVVVDSPEEAERIGLNHSTVRDVAEGKYGVSPELQRLAQRALENLRGHGVDI